MGLPLRPRSRGGDGVLPRSEYWAKGLLRRETGLAAGQGSSRKNEVLITLGNDPLLLA